MRKALVVGVDHYQHHRPLFGCAADADSVARVLERHGDRSKNFDVELFIAADEYRPVSKSQLRAAAESLFADDVEIALFYFAGHGAVNSAGGYILTSDCKHDDGLPLADIIRFANTSKALSKIIILDSCHSGAAGANSLVPAVAEIGPGLVILAASGPDQHAVEKNRAGVFTALFIDAMNGAAADLLGGVTPGNVYAHIDRSLGGFGQRPHLKANIKRFVSLRSVTPPIPLADLQRIDEFFPTPKHIFPLDPSFEPRDEARTPDMPRADPLNNQKFAVLQKYNRVNLLVPVDAPDMWSAAMTSTGCRLTFLGEHYRGLRADRRF